MSAAAKPQVDDTAVSDQSIDDGPAFEPANAGEAGVPAAANKGPALTVERHEAALPLPMILQTIQSRHGKSLHHILGEIVKLNFGPGKISVEEYLELGLFDDEGLAGADKRSFIGYAVSRKIWKRANFRQDWSGFFGDKLAVTTLLGAYGFEVIETLAVYSTKRCYPGMRTLANDGDLRAFLSDETNYPLFGKPVEGIQSLGVVSFDALDAETGRLISVDGTLLPIDDFVDDVTAHYGAGYIFQPRLRPHARVVEICGERIATVRIMTITAAEGPEILRALWKIPAGDNAADNFWRPGNLMAQLDITTGVIVRVVSGIGVDAVEHECHPDSGVQLVGTKVPNWGCVCETALKAASTLKELPLVGWDIAPTDGGAVIVEPNQTPDLHLPQMADRRGLMDERFCKFLDDCDQALAARKKAAKAEVLAYYRANRKRALKSATKR